jgi:hypothetical protein
MQLFTREGQEFTGTVQHNESGKAVHTVNVPCDRCHVFGGRRLWVMGTENGRPYSKTGFDCWTCGNTGVRSTRKERLFTAAELARVNKAAATRAARKAEAHRIAVEQAEAALVGKEAAFRTGNADFIAKLEALEGDYWDGFKQSFYARREAPTERQIALVEGEVAKRAANAASAFVGAVGDKITLTITVERVIVLEWQCYGTNIGNKGDTLTIKASVKEHVVYNGVNQTVIQRPKVVEEV